MKKKWLVYPFMFFCLGIFLFSFVLLNSNKEDKNQTLENTQNVFDTEINLDEASDRTKLASYTSITQGQTITIKDNFGLYWDIIGSSQDGLADSMDFSSRNTGNNYTVYIPWGDTFYGKDVDTGVLYLFYFQWGNGSIVTNSSEKTISKVVRDSDVPDSALNFSYGTVITESVGNIINESYSTHIVWYPQHDHEFSTTKQMFEATCLTPTYYADYGCSYCSATGDNISSGTALGHDNSITGTYGIFTYSTCSRDGWTLLNGVFESSENIRNTDQYSDYASEWESKIALSFSVNVVSNVELHYYVSSEENYDELYIRLDGKQMLSASGSEESDLTLSNISTGSHTLEFEYIKDGVTDSGDDLARITNLTVTSAQQTGYINLSSTSGSIPYSTASTSFSVASASGTLSVSDNNATATVSISGNTVTISNLATINAGSSIIVTVTAAENENYYSATATYTLTISKASITPTVSMNGYTYGGTVSTPSVSGNSGNGGVTYYYSTTNTNSGGTAWSGITSTSLNAGTYYMYATIAETTNYNSATTDTCRFIVKYIYIAMPRASEETFTYYGPAQIYTPDGFDSATMNITNDIRANAGTQQVIVSLKDKINYRWNNEDYDDNGDLIYTFTIEKASVTLKAENKESIYKEAIQELTYTVESGTNYGGEIVPTMTTTATSIASVGTYLITIEAQNDNYDITLINGEYRITPKEIEVIILNQTSAYTGKEPTVSQTAYTTMETDNLGITIAKESGVSAGIYKLTADYTNTNYDITFIYTQEEYSLYTIEEADYTILITNYTGIYDRQEHSGSIEIGLAEGKYTVYYSTEQVLDETNYTTCSTVKPTFQNAGKTTVYFYIASTDYKDTTGTYSVDITPKAITVGFSNYENLIYTGSVQSITAVLNGILEGDSCEISGITGNTAINAGSYTCEVESISNANYTLSGTTSLDWHIAKYQVEKPAEDTTVYTYNGENQTYQLTISDYYTISNNTQMEAGTYTIVIALLDTENYEWKDGSITNLEYTFNIEQKEVSIVWSEATFTYNGEEQEQTGIIAYYLTLPSNQKNYLTVKCNSESFRLAGVYTFTVELDDTKNYTVANTTDSHSYTIEKASITLKAENKESIYKEAIQELTYTVESGTNYGGEIVPAMTTTATSIASVGTYLITIEAQNDNYDITLINGEYKITPKEIEVIILNQTSAYTGKEPTVSQTAYTTMETDNLGITIAKESGVSAGIYKLTADYTNTNYDITFIYTQEEYSLYTIEEADYTVLITNYTGIYDRQEHSGSIEIGLAEGKYTVYYSTEQVLDETNYTTCSTVKPTFQNAGKTTVYFYIASTDYKDTTGTYSVDITPKAITVGFSDYENLIYTGSAQSITAVLNGILEGDSCEISGITGNTAINAGSYTCEVESISNANYTLSGTTSLDWHIAKATYTDITYENIAVIYQENLKTKDVVLQEGYTFKDIETVLHIGDNTVPAIYNTDPLNYENYELNITIAVNLLNIEELPKDNEGNIDITEDNYEDLKDILDDYNNLPQEEKDNLDTETKEELDKIQDAVDRYEEDNNILKETELFVLPTAADITYGASLSASVLSGGEANVEGVFTWKTSSVIPTAGVQTYEVVFTPSNPRYKSVNLSISVTVAKARPTITENPTTVKAKEGQKLSELTLENGTATVEGNFVWANPEEIVSKDKAEYHVIFVPTDSVNYETVELTISLAVGSSSSWQPILYASLSGVAAILLLTAVFVMLMKRKRK